MMCTAVVYTHVSLCFTLSFSWLSRFQRWRTSQLQLQVPLCRGLHPALPPLTFSSSSPCLSFPYSPHHIVLPSDILSLHVPRPLLHVSFFFFLLLLPPSPAGPPSASFFLTLSPPPPHPFTSPPFPSSPSQLFSPIRPAFLIPSFPNYIRSPFPYTFSTNSSYSNPSLLLL